MPRFSVNAEKPSELLLVPALGGSAALLCCSKGLDFASFLRLPEIVDDYPGEKTTKSLFPPVRFAELLAAALPAAATRSF